MASEGDVVLSYYDTCLRQSDVHLLEGHRWLNDNTISFWMEYLEHDLYEDVSPMIAFISPQAAQFIKSASYSQANLADVKQVVQDMDLKSKQLILFPVNDSSTFDEMGGSHWSLLTYITRNQSFEHYDSHTGSVNRLHAEHLVNILAPILIANHVSDIELDLTEMECTQQNNSYDCGIHLVCNAEAVCRKHFRNDYRHISEIASAATIRQARRDILKLVLSLKKKNTLEEEKELMEREGKELLESQGKEHGNGDAKRDGGDEGNGSKVETGSKRLKEDDDEDALLGEEEAAVEALI